MGNQSPRERLPDPERQQVYEMAKTTLWESEGEEALTYLRNVRGFKDPVIKQFQLGYVPHYVKRVDGEDHEFAGRIIIPVFDQYGNLVALSSRDWRENAYRKFYHESFVKGHYLYGLNIAKEHIIKRNKVIIVEGEFDAMYLHMSGFKFSVGVLGTSLQLYQLAMLLRYCREIFVLFDADASGNKARSKVVTLAETHQIDLYDARVVPVSMPDGYDPDDYIKEFGNEKFASLLRKSREELIESRSLKL